MRLSLGHCFPSPIHLNRSCTTRIHRIAIPNRQASRSNRAHCAHPSTFERLVAPTTGPSFRDVAQVETVSFDTLITNLQEDEVVLRVLCAGVNGGCETFRCRGDYAFSRNKEATSGFALGAEGVGEVVAGNMKQGTLVMFIGGAFSEYVKVKAAVCHPIIGDIRTQEESSLKGYAALRISGHVAHASLCYVANIEPGNVVLVTAAAGATGSFAVQYAKQKGCHVIATCRNEEKAALLDTLGADRIIDYSKEDIEAVLRSEYDQKVDVAYEGVGGHLQATAWDSLRPGGRLLSVGYISEYPHNNNNNNIISPKKRKKKKNGLPPSDELFWGGKTVTEDERNRTAYGNVWPSDASLRQQSLTEICNLHKQGDVIPIVDTSQTFQGVHSIPDAVDYMLSGHAIGKVVVQIQYS